MHLYNVTECDFDSFILADNIYDAAELISKSFDLEKYDLMLNIVPSKHRMYGISRSSGIRYTFSIRESELSQLPVWIE